MGFDHATRRTYLDMMARISARWLRLFENDPDLYSTAYWDLLTTLWAAGGPMRKTEALAAMSAVKSPHTAGKYLDCAVARGYVQETGNPADARSKLVQLSPWLKQRLDAFFDDAVNDMVATADLVRDRRDDSEGEDAA
ncbi:hypothetical protein SAMN05216241_10690 [Limimonas halophila]|uniref:DNA-binding transcriptional regulator, MarR family n=1 Tax=Limimonas halophila TaxID=1082479 RepID=A0A1G7S1W5_9PROT|nr:MarR family winged helix-turn-helix transcriptional regulator [Limimonas halophila]SDG17017.1 hypothetical protein SAMN05216241_10690 [Limimonas halophila]